ncbi:riboflavin kinase-like [Strix aluco]|uniref:riboflavin kinase-like n=1 Tax=Strix aluco TaxID=111821 RepID=UPI003DA588FE
MVAEFAEVVCQEEQKRQYREEEPGFKQCFEKGSNAFSWMQAVSSQKPQKLLRSLDCSSDLQALRQAEGDGQLTAQKGETDATCLERVGGERSARLETGLGPAPAAVRHLPYFCRGEVVKGFGRGFKELGIPTANFSEQVVESFPSIISTGIYYGWTCAGNGDVHKMVLSIGWNPFYKNIKKSVEMHIIHTFMDDFYGEILSTVILGCIQSEKNLSSLEALISAIQEDIEEAKTQLDLPEHLKLKEDNSFHLPEGKTINR